MNSPANGRVALILVGVVVLVVGLAFASVPAYDWFSRTTGYNGTAVAATGPASEVLDRTVLVRFDANVDKDLPWRFRPQKTSETVKLGQTVTALYEIDNPTDRTLAGKAMMSTAPDAAGGYLAKLSCFCDDRQALGPHERMELPVSFYVDPALIRDEDGKYVKEITLSFTYYANQVSPDQLAELVNAGVSGQQKTN